MFVFCPKKTIERIRYVPPLDREVLVFRLVSLKAKWQTVFVLYNIAKPKYWMVWKTKSEFGNFTRTMHSSRLHFSGCIMT